MTSKHWHLPSRKNARRQICEAATRHSDWTVYSLRHIQQAVCVVRQNTLLDEKVLITAGFNGKRKQ
jgi:hypothetical protein